MATIHKNEFQVVLPSNASYDYFKDNKPAHYKTKLPIPIQLEGEWEVAIIDLQYTHSWNNLKEEIKFGFWVGIQEQSNQNFTHTDEIYNNDFDAMMLNELKIQNRPYLSYRSLILPIGYYSSMSDICNFLTTEFREAYAHILDGHPERTYAIKFNAVTNRVTLKSTGISVCICTPSDRVAKLFGFAIKANSRGVHTIMNGTGANPAEKLEQLNTIYVYSDIAQYQQIGGTQAPLLGLLPVEGETNQQKFWSFVPPYYIPVIKSYMSTIEIQLCNDIGDNIQFAPESHVVTRLHFRRKNPWVGI